MNNEEKSSQKNVLSKDLNEVSFQVPEVALKPIYLGIERAAEVISFSYSKGWSKDEFIRVIKILSSLEHF